MRNRITLLNTKYFVIAVCLVISATVGFAIEGDGVFVASNTAEWSADFYSCGIWSEHPLELPLHERVGLALEAGLILLDLQNSSSSGSSDSSDVLDSAFSGGSVRDELGWTLTKTLLNASLNLIDTNFVAYFKFDLR